MSDEEIRMECLKLAASIVVDDINTIIELANDLRKYVIQDRYPTENKIEFEKINALRPME